jgi:predicted methyltransferase
MVIKLRRILPPLLTADSAERILSGNHKVSLDLGLSEIKVTVEDNIVILNADFHISIDDLRTIKKKQNAVFFPDGDMVYQVAISDRRFYKLMPTDGAPTLEIDGVRMHRTKDTQPELDTADKLEALGLSGGKVLDTCMGLGYTAVNALSCGGEVVVTMEQESAVVKIAELNPWSRRLFGGEINILLGDSFFAIDSFPQEYFDWVIHDPPRLSHAGNLYSEKFYSKLHKIMAQGARLFHYTGEPRSRYRRVDLQKGVQRRLRRAGFKSTTYHPGVMGITCEK